MQLGASVRIDTLDIMAGRKAVGAEVARRFQQIGEFDGLVAANAGDRGLAAKIAVGEILHHLVVKATFVIEHIMRDAEPSGDGARVVNIGTGTARPLGLDGDAVIIKLQGDPHDLVSLLMKQGCRDGTVDTAGHRDDDARVGRRLGKTERIDRGVTRRVAVAWRCRGHEAPSFVSVASRNPLERSGAARPVPASWQSGIQGARSPTG